MFDLAALDDLPALWILAITTLLHELGVPLPMSPAALVVGARVAAGAVDLLLPVAAIVGATLIGNSVWFAAGRRYGLGALRLVNRLPLSLDTGPGRSFGKFERWGGWLLVVGRFIPGVALVAPPLAGATGMRWSRFLMLTAAGAALYGLVIVGAGMVLHHQVESVLALVEGYGQYTVVVVVSAVAIYFAWRWARRRAGQSASASVATPLGLPSTCPQ
jgi:membrane protein DedA with SNARE-associated domain